MAGGGSIMKRICELTEEDKNIWKMLKERSRHHLEFHGVSMKKRLQQTYKEIPSSSGFERFVDGTVTLARDTWFYPLNRESFKEFFHFRMPLRCGYPPSFCHLTAQITVGP